MTHASFTRMWLIGGLLGVTGCSLPITSQPSLDRSAPANSPERPYSITALVTVRADDYATIQTAIDAVTSTGGTVLLSPRTYMISSTLVMPRNVALVGETATDSTLPVLQLATTANCDVIRNKRPFDSTFKDLNIRLANFKIDGNRPGQTGNRHGVNFSYVESPVIEGVTIENCSGSGITFNYCNNGTIRYNTVSSNGLTASWATTGINLNQGCTGNLLDGNTCNGNNGYRTVVGGVLTTYDGNGIRVGDNSDRNTLTNNQCSGNGRRGIKVQASDNVVVNNVLTDNFGHSLALHGLKVSSNRVEGNTITTYSIPSFWNSGIYLSDVDGPVSNNILQNNRVEGALSGIEMSGTASNSLLCNTVLNSRTHGIYLRGTCDNLLKGNTVANSGQSVSCNGIQLIIEGGRSTLRNRLEENVAFDDQATKTQAFGLKIDPGVDETTILNNDFRNNKFSPGWSLSGANNTVSGNLY